MTQSRKTYTKSITTKLNEEEVELKNAEVAQLDIKINEVTEEKKRIVGKYTTRLKAMIAERDDILSDITACVSIVEVEVYDRVNEQLQQMETVRAADGVVLEEFTRALTKEERQEELPFEKANEDALADAIAPAPGGPPATVSVLAEDGTAFLLTSVDDDGVLVAFDSESAKAHFAYNADQDAFDAGAAVINSLEEVQKCKSFWTEYLMFNGVELATPWPIFEDVPVDAPFTEEENTVFHKLETDNEWPNGPHEESENDYEDGLTTTPAEETSGEEPAAATSHDIDPGLF